MLRSSLVRTLTDKSQLAPDSACCCAAANGESTSSTKTHASARTIFPPLSGLCAPVNFRPVKQYSNESASGPIPTIPTAGGSQLPHLSSAHHCGPESHPLQRTHEPRRPLRLPLCSGRSSDRFFISLAVVAAAVRGGPLVIGFSLYSLRILVGVVRACVGAGLQSALQFVPRLCRGTIYRALFDCRATHTAASEAGVVAADLQIGAPHFVTLASSRLSLIL